MGLDMYLRAKRFVTGYENSPKEEREFYARLLAVDGSLARLTSPDTPHAEVSVMVAYWRKANAIHQWFVNNVQDGKDDCGEYYVSRENLIDLRNKCAEVLKIANVSNGQPNLCGTTYYPDGRIENKFEMGRAILNQKEIATILPTQGGFFFGSTDYGEYFLQDVESTIEQIDRALQLGEEWSLEYHASW